jgi:hypothetical protein
MFFCVDVYWYYILDNDAKWDTIIHHALEYEAIGYLDCFTFLFLYLWLAVKLLRLACKPKRTWTLFYDRVLSVVIRRWKIHIQPRLTFDTLFKIVLIVIALVVVRHALDYEFHLRSLVIISDIRPMANIYYDICCPLQWLYSILL